MIVIVDYQMGNVGSIQNMLKKIGVASLISSDVTVIEKAEKLILPGVGAFDQGISNINALGLRAILDYKATVARIPILGICLGMQLFTRGSAEGSLPGLSWLDAETIRFDFGNNPQRLKIPHMGWNTVQIQNNQTLFAEMDDESRFYFVHSYHVVCDSPKNVLARTYHGYDFTSAVQSENIYGTQFHPEKSHKYGMKLLANFAGLTHA